MTLGTDDTHPQNGGAGEMDDQRHRATEARVKRLETEWYGDAAADGGKTAVSKLRADMLRLERMVETGFAEMRRFADEMRASLAHPRTSWTEVVLAAAGIVVAGLMLGLAGSRFGWW